uniref:hypothetical protein n=1 Tax=Streptomyces sp. WI03-5b TaxID=462946 RepID=UPI0039F4E73B
MVPSSLSESDSDSLSDSLVSSVNRNCASASASDREGPGLPDSVSSSYASSASRRPGVPSGAGGG